MIQPTPRPSWFKRHKVLAVIGACCGLFVISAIIAGIVDPSPPTDKTATSSVSNVSRSPSASAPTTAPPITIPASLEPGAPAPPGVFCADVGGVFVAHGTDGRGDCMSADPRPKCHVAPANQDGNYLAELTMTPPFPGGTIDNPELIGMASNKDCWKQPTS